MAVDRAGWPGSQRVRRSGKSRMSAVWIDAPTRAWVSAPAVVSVRCTAASKKKYPALGVGRTKAPAVHWERRPATVRIGARVPVAKRV